jgi:hypothetical protein
MGRQTNPYSSPVSQPDVAHRRPTATTVVAVLLFVGGCWLGAGLIIRTVQDWQTRGLPERASSFARTVHFAILSLVAVAASWGLMTSRRWGWWAAMVACYLLLASFTLVPVIYNLFNGNTPAAQRAVWGLAMSVYWLSLNRAAVLRYFGLDQQRRWVRHLILFVLCLITVLSLVEFGD